MEGQTTNQFRICVAIIGMYRLYPFVLWCVQVSPRSDADGLDTKRAGQAYLMHAIREIPPRQANWAVSDLSPRMIWS